MFYKPLHPKVSVSARFPDVLDIGSGIDARCSKEDNMTDYLLLNTLQENYAKIGILQNLKSSTSLIPLQGGSLEQAEKILKRNKLPWYIELWQQWITEEDWIKN